MKYLFPFLFTLCFQAFAQDYPLLSPEERAYFFHIVKKSPILEKNMGRFVEYIGKPIYLTNGKVHYDSIEEIIIQNPELLVIRQDEIAKSAKGLLAEAANKMAIFELNKALLAKSKNDKDNESDRVKYEQFETLLKAQLPVSAFKMKNDVRDLHPKLSNVFNPSLSLKDKIDMLESFRFLDFQDRLTTIQAINWATNVYVEKRSRQIYHALGGREEVYENILIAAGDGSNTSGMLEEREKDEKGRWNKGLPKAVGLFPYQVAIVESPNEKKNLVKAIEPARVARLELQTVGNNRQTNLHFDVWGYNSKKQTTVVIEKNGKTYRLFGSGQTRFLSPDSAFAEGATFQSIINDMEFNKIRKIEDMIYGKRGYDYWIDYNQKKKDETEMKIERYEKKYSDFGYRPVVTDKRPSRAVRKAKKKSKVLTDYQPTTDSNKEKRAETQDDIVSLYGLFNGYKKKIKELEAEKKEALEILSDYQMRLEQFKRDFGKVPLAFSEKDGLYTFEDSTTFDVFTQEFVFPATRDTMVFDVRLIAIPESPLSKSADEVMLHVNKMDSKPGYDARIQLELLDLFESDAYLLKQNIFAAKDSIALRMFFEGLLNKKVEFDIIARGMGIGQIENGEVVKNPNPAELPSYPGTTSEEKTASKMDSSFLLLRRTEINIDLNRGIELEVNSFTDPVKSNVVVQEAELLEQFNKYNLSKNEQLSVLRTYAVLMKLKEEINVLAGSYMSRPDAKIIIDRFNKALAKTKINVGRIVIKANF